MIYKEKETKGTSVKITAAADVLLQPMRRSTLILLGNLSHTLNFTFAI